MPDLEYVKLTGRLGLTVGDGPDPDEQPDTVWADEGTVRIIPLNSYTKVAGATPVPWTAGHGVIEAGINSDGYVSWSGQPYVWLVDLTSDKVNPRIGDGKATHRIEFRNVKAGGTKVEYETQNIRIAADAVDPVSGAVDLTLALPVPTAGGTPIVVGPPGVGVASVVQDEPTSFALELTNGQTTDEIELPVGPGGSDSGVAGYIATPGSATNSALSAQIAQLKVWARNLDQLIVGAITRDGNGAATSAPVKWPDGSPGTYTATTVSTAFPGAVDAYTVTYGSPVTRTITQPAVTREPNGAVTNLPELTVA
jgi:hypothetical protein